MNKHILLVMKWLNDKDSVSEEELKENKSEAFEVYKACASADANFVAAYNAVAAAYCPYYAGYWVDEYFDRTGENRNEYLKELEK